MARSPSRAGRGRCIASRARRAPSSTPVSTASQIDAIIDKGQAPGREGYSGFEGTELERLLREHGVDAVDVAGLALDYCVKATALDAKRAGLNVTVHRGATRAVEVKPGTASALWRSCVPPG